MLLEVEGDCAEAEDSDLAFPVATDDVVSAAVLSADVRRTFNLSIASSGDVLASLQVCWGNNPGGDASTSIPRNPRQQSVIAGATKDT